MPNKRQRNSNKKSQKGGNYHFGVERSKIGGLAEVVRVDDPIAPTVLASKDTFPIPLYLKQKGGKRHSSKKRSNKKLSKRKSSKKRKTRKSKQRGGSSGELSVYTPDMTQREFNCNQPVWSPKCT